MEQVRKAHAKSAAKVDTAVADVAPAADTTDLKAELDDFLDEIDSVLEENAQTFVQSYIQKGGQ